MIRIKPSLDILLEDVPSKAYRPDPHRELAPIFPYSQHENIVARRGLGRHIDVLYKGVRRSTLSHNLALLAVYNFFVDDVDNFRQQAQNAISALTKEESPAYFAPIIALTRLGVTCRKTRKSPEGTEKDERLIELLNETLGFKDDLSVSMREWALRSAKNNRLFWFKQLEANRRHPLVLSLAQEIKNAQP